MIDTASTSAEIDTLLNEVRLPKNTAGMVAFWPGNVPDYVVATPDKIIHFSYDGTGYSENVILELTPDAAIKAAAVSESFPDLKLAAGAQIRHYSFDGTNYARNSALEKEEMEAAYTVSNSRTGEFVTLVNGEIQRYVYDGTSMVRNSALEPDEPLNNLVDAELFSKGSGLDLAVLTGDSLRVFRWNGAGTPQPTVVVESNLTNPKDIYTTKKDLVLVDDTAVSHYSNSGNSWAYNGTLSIAAGLDDVKAVAANDKTLDKIVVNGTEIKYYRWDGTQLVYDESMSVEVPELESVTYRPQVVIQSKAFDPLIDVNNVRVRAYHSLADGQSVTYSVTADGTNWVTKWRVRGEAGATVCEVTNDNGTTWTVIGDASQGTPDVDRSELWAEVLPGRSVKWRAVLKTNDVCSTPKIKPFIMDGIAVSLQAGQPPDAPVIDPVGAACFTTTTPTFNWTYTDPDGDSQKYYQVRITRKSDNALIYDSGKVYDVVENNEKGSHTVTTSSAPDVAGPLWNSGEYEFNIQVKVWDLYNLESPWSIPVDFCVVAFERPRIAEIISPPDGQTAPEPSNSSTHLVITPEMEEEELPRAKAGARVKLLVDSIGPLAELTTVKFPYLTLESTVKNPVVSHYPSGDNVNRWEIDFWTDAELKKCPTGTVVQMQLTGDAGSEGVTMFDAPPYANGVLVTEGSIYEDWFVVLQGRD